jgi:hypothetical protein
MDKIFRPGSPFAAWVAAGAVCFACIGILNPTIWFSADVLGLARFLAAGVGALLGGIIGAVVGALIGIVAALRAAGRPAPADKKAAARARDAARMTYVGLVFGGLVLGVGGGAFNLATTPERGSFTACTAIQKDLDEARAALTNGVWATTIARVNDALGRTKSCNGSAGKPLVTGALYALRGAAYLQTDLLPARSDKDINRAADLIRNCKSEWAGTDRAPLCEQFTVTVERYRTQHFCDESLAFANRADNELYSNASAAKADAERGIASAGKCKNTFNFAYRGIALAQRGQAQAALGQSATASLTEGQKLLARCIKALGSGRGLGGQCKGAQQTIASVRAGRIRPGT